MKIHINLIVSIICTILLLACSSSNREQIPQEEKTISQLVEKEQIAPLKLDTIVDTTRIINSNMALEVLSTYYPDSSFGEEAPQFIYAIFEQQIRMYNTTNDTMVLDTILPVKKVERNFKRLGKVEVLENVISEIGWTEGQKGDILFWVKGFGGCFNCSESIAFISPSGEVISFLYSRRGFFKIAEDQPDTEEIYPPLSITDSSPKKSVTIKPFFVFWQW